MYEVTFQDYQVPPSQNFQPGDTIPDDPPPADPATLTELQDDVETILTGTGGTISDGDLALLAPDEWESFLVELFGFVNSGPQGSDQNSYYDNHESTSPLGELFLHDFGWMHSVWNLAGYSYYDYLTQGADPEYLEMQHAAHVGMSALASHGVNLNAVAGFPFTMVVNGQAVLFTWHPGAVPPSRPSSEDGAIVAVGSLGYWTCDTQGLPGDLQTQTPIASDFTGHTLATWPLQAEVNEALRYLANSPAALQLMRDARANHVTIVLETEHESFTTGSIVHWNPHAGLRINGDLQSPAMVLMHEMAHALDAALLIPHLPDAQYGDSEERHAIVDYEQVIAQQLHEPIRFSHAGPEVTVAFGVGVIEHTTK